MIKLNINIFKTRQASAVMVQPMNTINVVNDIQTEKMEDEWQGRRIDRTEQIKQQKVTFQHGI